MSIEEGFFETTDGLDLFYRFQPSDSGNRPLVLLLHGHGEHTGRYLKFFSRLKDLGHPIATFDLRGCGRSGGPPVYVSRFEDYLEDVSCCLGFLRGRYGINGPFFLFGHSLGGLIAAAWAREKPREVSRMILSSPLFAVPKAGFLKPLVNFLDGFFPRLVIRNPVKPPFLTHDPEEVAKYELDPLIRRRITVRLSHEMIKYSEIFTENGASFPFPVYILMAGKDFVVDPEGTRRFFRRLEAPSKELETFPGFYHEIFNEVGQEKAFERLRHYLNL